MSNKRVSELARLMPGDLANNDLFLVSDSSVPESKYMYASDISAWLGASASLSLVSSSTSDTASFLLYTGIANGTASFSISGSWSETCISASHVPTASISITSSHALTASALVGLIQGNFTSSNSNTSSFLLYSGVYNGSASFALTSSRSSLSNTSSYISWFGGNVDNGTVYNSISASIAQTASYVDVGNLVTANTASFSYTSSLSNTASFLKYTGASNGTSSYSMVAKTASNATSVSEIRQERILREYGPFTSSILNTNTASFGYCEITKSAYTTYNRVVAEVWGDIQITLTGSSQTSSLTLNAYDNVFASADLDLDKASFQNYMTGSGVEPSGSAHFHTGSITTGFYLKGVMNGLPSPGNYLWSVKSSPGILFITSSRPVRMQLKLNTDYVNSGQSI